MKIIMISVMLILMLASASVLFGSGFALSGVGSRAIAMGGAFRGMSDDATSMYWNPAGLGFMNETSLSLGGSFFLPATQWDGPIASASTIGFPEGEFEAVSKLRAFPSVFFTEENEARWKWGFSVFVPYGLGATWDAYNLPTTGQPGLPANTPLTYAAGFPEEEMMSSIAIIDAHPTLSYKVLPNLSVGAGISLMYGMIDILKAAPHPALGYFAPTTFDLSGSGMGVGANFGLMYKPLRNLSVGLSGKIPASLKMTGDADVNLWLNNYTNYAIWGNNPAFLVPAIYGTNGDTSDIETTLPLPGEIGGGISYKLMPNWAINLDYAYTMWSRLDKVTVEMDTVTILAGHPTSQTVLTERDLNFQWEDTSRISVGTEYKFHCNAIRAGFFYEESPIPDETMSPTFPDINTKMSFNLGLGKAWGDFTFDINGQYVMFEERVVDTQTADNMTGTYNSNVISGNVGIGYRF